MLACAKREASKYQSFSPTKANREKLLKKPASWRTRVTAVDSIRSVRTSTYHHLDQFAPAVSRQMVALRRQQSAACSAKSSTMKRCGLATWCAHSYDGKQRPAAALAHFEREDFKLRITRPSAASTGKRCPRCPIYFAVESKGAKTTADHGFVHNIRHGRTISAVGKKSMTRPKPRGGERSAARLVHPGCASVNACGRRFEYGSG